MNKPKNPNKQSAESSIEFRRYESTAFGKLEAGDNANHKTLEAAMRRHFQENKNSHYILLIIPAHWYAEWTTFLECCESLIEHKRDTHSKSPDEKAMDNEVLSLVKKLISKAEGNKAGMMTLRLEGVVCAMLVSIMPAIMLEVIPQLHHMIDDIPPTATAKLRFAQRTHNLMLDMYAELADQINWSLNNPLAAGSFQVSSEVRANSSYYCHEAKQLAASTRVAVVGEH